MTRQLVNPNPGVKDYAGFCLRFTQAVYGAPAQHSSAWEAWEATSYKHGTAESIPAVSVPVWFSHYGTYGKPPTYANWGHVVAYIPGTGYLSSPGEGYGSQIFDSIQAVEAYFNAHYVGWSEDLNGLRIAEITNTPTSSKGDTEMLMIHKPSGDANIYRYAVFSGSFWMEFVGQDVANGFSAQIGAASVKVTNDFWNVCKASAQAGARNAK